MVVDLAFILLIYFSLLTATLIHEVGHLIAAKYAGHEITFFAVGPVSITFYGGNSNIRLRKALTSGIVSFNRKGDTPNLKLEAIIASGGIVANILVGMMFVGLYFAALDFCQVGIFMAIGATSIFVGLVNLFPRHSKTLGKDNDAMVLLYIYHLWKNQNRKQKQ